MGFAENYSFVDVCTQSIMLSLTVLSEYFVKPIFFVNILPNNRHSEIVFSEFAYFPHEFQQIFFPCKIKITQQSLTD